MPKRIKSDHCLNCHTPLTPEDNFCPSCGQENNDYNQSIWPLILDFLGKVVDIDSRFTKSIRPFFTKPGMLTEAFMEGKRKTYVHPLRFYLIASFSFFFLFSLNPKLDLLQELSGDFQSGASSALVEEKAQNLLTQKLQKQLEAGKIDSTTFLAMQEDLLKEITAVADSMDERPEEDLGGLTQPGDQGDYTKGLEYVVEQGWIDSTELRMAIEAEKAAEEDEEDDDDFSSTSSVSLFGTSYVIDWDKLWDVWVKDPAITPDILLDSLQASDKNAFNRRFAKQTIKLGKQRTDLLVREIINNIPAMVFLMLPLFGVLLNLLYLRSKKRYIAYLVFTLHYHTFVFLYFSFAMLIYLLTDNPSLVGWGFVLVVVYLFAMLRNYFKQGYFKTFVKMCILGFMYQMLFVFFLIFEILFSVLSF